MSVTVEVLNAGTNNYQTPADGVNRTDYWMFSAGVPAIGTISSVGNQKTGDFAVQAQGTPNGTVKIKSGRMLMKATPTSEAERMFPVVLSADYNLTIAANATGSTKYDKVYLYLPPATLHNPPVSGDQTEVACLLAERHNAAGEALSATNAVELAEITVINGFSSLADTDIVEKRVVAGLLSNPSAASNGWTSPSEIHTYASGVTVTVPAGALLKYAIGDKYTVTQNVPINSYWSFDTNSADAKGTATMTNIGTPTYTAGKFSNALTLNGTNQALAITDATVFKPTGAFTIRYWVKVASAPGATQVIVQSKSVNTNWAGWDMYMSTGGTIVSEFGKNTSASASGFASIGNICDNAWHKVCLSFQSGYAKIIIDGVLNASGSVDTPVYAATNYVRIGCSNGSGTNGLFFAGQIDDMDFINGYAVSEIEEAKQYALATAQTSANITPTYYGYITAVVDTLFTVTGGADYVLYNSALTNPYYSHGNAVGFPEWFNYSPAYTGFSVNPGAYHSRFMINGRKATVDWVSGTDGTSNATGFTISFPITPRIGFSGICGIHDNAWLTTVGYFVVGDGQTTLTIQKTIASPNFITSGTKNAILPVLSYEI
jgi:hypothetical protein